MYLYLYIIVEVIAIIVGIGMGIEMVARQEVDEPIIDTLSVLNLILILIFHGFIIGAVFAYFVGKVCIFLDKVCGYLNSIVIWKKKVRR